MASSARITSPTAADFEQSRNLLAHPTILGVASAVMNPYWNGPNAVGNWGRWNFGGVGPLAAPPPIRTGVVGAVVTLPGAMIQTIHADTAHTHTHVQLPPHYLNLFIPAAPAPAPAVHESDYYPSQGDGIFSSSGRTPITSTPPTLSMSGSNSDSGSGSNSGSDGFAVGQTAFVCGSHDISTCARMMTEAPPPAPTPTSTPTPTHAKAKAKSSASASGSASDSGSGSGSGKIGPSECEGESELERCMIRPHLLAGDATLMDCRLLHFGLENLSSHCLRPLLYINYTQEYFSDPKNWNDSEKLFPQ